MTVELVPLVGPAIVCEIARPDPVGYGARFYFAGVITGRMRATGFHRESHGGRAEAILESAPDVVVYLERA